MQCIFCCKKSPIVSSSHPTYDQRTQECISEMDVGLANALDEELEGAGQQREDADYREVKVCLSLHKGC